ncbi:MAG: aspartate carbamoyltransferase catalytic subunit [Candidatus Cloacimonetes bacterium]|jgi:aspartate carbamoyltransferase catalytic subunit|uniref:Aspartate carbamoyltransferase catalytic subunit n=1 Tax=Candidatus Syntrophosphaera thermopropionivorans TaxID=2593015 RepID=A0AC61QIW1_9BACT|nr:aspartate carbamoyltransferase catalytic subunit [Candidatus Syntrophosphaera thermopropionivorans]NLA44343.1 aspartate carbamoyltransferase catalytic subunit [Candidatus Cloacimonadota bacterium]HRQ98802.1 aspartate carbamoyltransferase catalytic subunit [Candidatus Syntrophosphaera sp.]TDF72867.1 aspartate carbamoyltransferase catalytic subunit [Candidatus Syntrophosphaera thermopropionivorans]HOH82630.1 aspartate carbamoyltransferase catalytic subunit [Candidatus Syntrophosphaera thermopr
MESTPQFVGRSLYDLDDYSSDEIMYILEAAKGMKEINLREYKKIPTLRGKTVCTLFVEDSTRTRMSFELAASRLSADVVSFQATVSSLKKGESLQDTVNTLNAMGIDLYCIRHSSPGSPQLVHKYSGKPVINGGDGRHAHPTQALLDIFSIWERLGNLKGLKITIVGDILNSRVVRSDLIGMTKLGMEVTVCGPRTLMPANMEQIYGCKVEYDLAEALKDADIVMGLRMQLERMTEGLFPSLEEYSRHYVLSKETIKYAKKDALIMHPGPMNRGIEILPEIADSAQSIIVEQVANGVAVRMALMFLILGGKL